MVASLGGLGTLSPAPAMSGNNSAVVKMRTLFMVVSFIWVQRFTKVCCRPQAASFSSLLNTSTSQHLNFYFQLYAPCASASIMTPAYRLPHGGMIQLSALIPSAPAAVTAHP